MDAEVLNDLLIETGYDDKKRNFVVNGFRHGFSIGYQGKSNVRIKSPNLRLVVGDEVDLWNKVMKEVGAKRYAGPFEEENIPFRHFIQSPIGLVPKDNGKNTRLIFHLSYPRKPNSTSVNANTPDHLGKVQYPDFSKAINLCLAVGRGCRAAKSDMSAAFRQLGVMRRHWKYLVLKARSPLDGKWYYFLDKAIPFGGKISCSHFQKVSDCIAHIVKIKTGHDNVNYLDDYLFIAFLEYLCNKQLRVFLDICDRIRFPVSIEKTIFACTQLTFLGFLINTITFTVSIPCEKLAKAKNMIEYILKQGKPIKIKVLQLQKICGFLNFIGRDIVPGRAFTRRLYSKLNNNQKSHHHIRVNGEMQADLQMWLRFVQHPSAYSRTFLDYSNILIADEIEFYVDASKNPLLGFGGYSGRDWMQSHWNPKFITICDPSIEYLELFAMTAAILAWISKFRNRRVILFTDNESVMNMLNSNSSKCKNCMVLIRLVVMESLVNNVRFYARHVRSHLNGISDSLSCFQMARFRRLTKCKNLHANPSPIPECIWPIEKIWLAK